MKKTKEEILQAIKEIAGEELSDAYVALLEDVSDSMVEVEPIDEEAIRGEYEEKLSALDSEWRQKYTDRFFGASEEEVIEETAEEIAEEIVEEVVDFDDLFESEDK